MHKIDPRIIGNPEVYGNRHIGEEGSDGWGKNPAANF
jgi:hypothetical protein